MGIVLIVVGVAVLAVAVGVILSVGEEEGWIKWVVALVAVVISIASMVGGVYLLRLRGVSRLEAFQSYTLSAYEATIDETRNLISVDISNATLVEGSIEKMEIASDVANRIAELRDKTEQYNADLAYMARMDGIPIIGLAYPNVDHLDYIEIGR